jgi:membrane-associated phospholipid phosphatase
MEKVSIEYESNAVSRAKSRFWTLDYFVFGYTAYIALFTVIFYERMPHPLAILALHVFIMTAMTLVPRRGASWESVPMEGWIRHVRGFGRFFRYSYPLLLILFFFEEGHQTVNAMWPSAPHWFESYLYAADRWIFGELPAILMNDWVGPIQDEVLHFFYFSYYFIFVGGVTYAWFGAKGSRQPARGFQTTLTSVIVSFLLCFIWYPYLPARGPWEDPALMARMTPFEGFVFVPIIERIIEHGAVSGGCFPSSHVAGAWATVLALFRFHRKVSLTLAVFALGMSIACVYTRYHHAVDVFAGIAAALVGTFIACQLTRSETRALASWR